MAEKLVALVPMRHHSERVAGKNYRLLAGRPLYGYILETLLACDGVARVVVDTDSEPIKTGISSTYPQVILLDRPPALCGGEIPMNEVLLHDVSQVDSAYYLQTHSTNPLLRKETVQQAIEAFFSHLPQHDSLFSVTRLQTRLWYEDGRPLNHDPGVLLRTQDLPPLFEENSCLYIFSKETLVKRHNRLGANPLLFEIPEREAVDIDTEFNFQVAECLVRTGR